MPRVTQPKRMTWPATAVRVAAPPVLDGEMGAEEWPGKLVGLDRAPSRWRAGGAPVFAKLAYDDRCLYVAVNAITFDVTKLRQGTTWGQDDGVELSIAGKTPAGKPTVFVLRGYSGGQLQSVTDAGAPAEAAQRLKQKTRFTARVYGKRRGGWRSEWTVPLEALGLKPAPGLKVPFNLTVYRSEDEVWRCWEGTKAESWKLDQGGMLQFK